MSETTTYVTQSKFYSPAFNAAIFDGPIRIYFAQYQEAQALKLYFTLHERFRDLHSGARRVLKERGSNVFVMIYPSKETFDHSFPPTKLVAADERPVIACERLGRDYVLGVCGPLEDDNFQPLYDEMESIVQVGSA